MGENFFVEQPEEFVLSHEDVKSQLAMTFHSKKSNRNIVHQAVANKDNGSDVGTKLLSDDRLKSRS